jgi:ABC-type sulfate transport system substrate-binding protein
LAVGLVAPPALTAGVVSMFAPVAMAQSAANSRTITIFFYAFTKSTYNHIFKLFAVDWQIKTGQTVALKCSHVGSGSQAKAVIDYLEADVVSLAMAVDVNKTQ